MNTHLVRIIATLVLITAVTSGCVQEPSLTETGRLTITLLTDEMATQRNIDPEGSQPLDMTSYTISGSGPLGQILETITSSSKTVTIGDLNLGDWTFLATGYNSSGKAIAQGTVEGHITGNDNVVTIMLDDCVGEGSLDLACTWNPQQTKTDSTISMELIDAEGSQVPGLTIERDFIEGTARLHGEGIPSGFYTAIVNLKTNGELVGGFVETVRIIENTESSAQRVLQIGRVVESVNISIIDNTSAPVEGTIVVTPSPLESGMEATLAFLLDEGQNATIEDLTMQWYCDGVAIVHATSETYTTGILQGGSCRYDIVVSLPLSGSVGSAGVLIEIPVTPHILP